MFRTFKIAAVAAIAALGISAGVSQADTVLQSGSTVDGWTITFPAGVGLVVDSTLTNSSTLALEKFPEFTNVEGLPITFTQAGPTAAASIDFANEQITNLSGTTWSGFQYLLVNVSAGMGAGTASFDQDPSIPSPFAPPVGYTGVSIDSPQSITYSGSQASGVTSNWGFGADGNLVINANPSAAGGPIAQDFVFKEQPLVSTNMVPLSAAAWQSLAGLLALGLIASIKNARKFLA